MTDHLRRIAVFVDEPEKGIFHWVLIENEGGGSMWSDLEHSPRQFETWVGAFDAGALRLNEIVMGKKGSVRAVFEDEDADPVG